MQVIAGKYKGRKLQAAEEISFRPMTNFAKQGIFSMLEYWRFVHPHANVVFGSRVADICCGIGAVGIEALSRGATHVTFVDVSGDSIRFAENNMNLTDKNASAEFILSDATRLPKAKTPFDIVFVTPPYRMQLAEPIVESLQERDWLQPGTIVIVEVGAKENFTVPAGLQQLDERGYAAAKMIFLIAT